MASVQADNGAEMISGIISSVRDSIKLVGSSKTAELLKGLSECTAELVHDDNVEHVHNMCTGILNTNNEVSVGDRQLPLFQE